MARRSSPLVLLVAMGIGCSDGLVTDMAAPVSSAGGSVSPADTARPVDAPTPANGGSVATGGAPTANGGAGPNTINAGGAIQATGGTPASAGEAEPVSEPSVPDEPAAIDGPSAFRCVNWADPRDNFVNGLLALSGLSSGSDTYETVRTKADAILAEFRTKLGANAVRIPINEPTVADPWWDAYKAVIDSAVAQGIKTIIAYWAYQNGMPDDTAAFMDMWQTVVSEYQASNLVFFDIHNEPYGFGSGWNDAAAAWLATFPDVPRARVIVAGTGYDDDVKPVGDDPRFAGTLLELHIYGFWHTDWTTRQQWRDSMSSMLGGHAERTLVGEWGAPMTTGTDYSVDADGNVNRAYVRAVSDVMRESGMGSCYWPGLRNGDSYSMTTLDAATNPLTLTVTNSSGLDRVHAAWQL